MIRSSLSYPSQTQYDYDKFPGMKRISQALICTVATARQAHPERRKTRFRNRLQPVRVTLAPPKIAQKNPPALPQCPVR